MNKYKVVASKTNKKYTIIVSADSEFDARNKVHNWWYSILSVEYFDDAKIEWRKFVFILDDNWEEKKWIIVGNDIYKLYLKLVNDLWYKVKYLYPQEEENSMSDEEKKHIIHMLSTGKSLVETQQSKKEIQDFTKKQEESVDVKEIDESFYMKKELEETQNLIDSVLLKLTPIINQEKNYNLSPEKLQKLHNIYQGIMSIKNSTNIAKLKKIWEVALIKIWEIELKALEENKSQASKELLDQTNSLLKQIGSSEKFKEKEWDFGYTLKIMFEQWWEGISNFFENIKNRKERKKELELDKQSFAYLKNGLLLNKYSKKLNENTQNMYKNIFAIIFPFWENQKIKEEIMLRRSVIKQNISLLEAKKRWKVQSYTNAIKWGNRVVSNFIALIQWIGHFMYYVVYSFSLIFVWYMFLIKWWFALEAIEISYNGIYFVILFSIFAALGSATKNIFLFIFSSWFFAFLLMFLQVNF